MKWFQYLQIGAFIAGWISKSIQDGVITQKEINELVLGILNELDIKDIKILK